MTTIILLTVIVSLAVLSFGLGYTSSERNERRAAAFVRKQRFQISQWVHKNWPTEHAAYNQGHTEGYQQGVLQAHELEEDHPE